MLEIWEHCKYKLGHGSGVWSEEGIVTHYVDEGISLCGCKMPHPLKQFKRGWFRVDSVVEVTCKRCVKSYAKKWGL